MDQQASHLTPSSQTRSNVWVIMLMALGFGLIGIDRFLITALFPVIAHDLHLGYSDIGTITGVLALAWGCSALCMGNLSDRIGRRRVLTWALVAFSLLIGASGLAAGLASLIFVRVIMGFADGAYAPVSIATTLSVSAPSQEGRNIGIQQTMLPLFGLGIGPLLVVLLLQFISWRLIFPLFALPGLLIAWLVRRAVSDDDRSDSHGGALFAWRQVIAVRNVQLCMGMMLCWLTCLIVTSAMLPSYLTDFLHLPFSKMASVMSAIGIGSAVGTMLLPWLSDKTRRRFVMTRASIGSGLSLLMLARTSAAPGMLFLWLFLVHFFNNALITLTVGPLCVRSVPTFLAATATGVVIAAGEILGGGLMPVIAGLTSDRLGISHVLVLPTVTAFLGLVLCICLRDGRSPESIQELSPSLGG